MGISERICGELNCDFGDLSVMAGTKKRIDADDKSSCQDLTNWRCYGCLTLRNGKTGRFMINAFQYNLKRRQRNDYLSWELFACQEAKDYC